MDWGDIGATALSYTYGIYGTVAYEAYKAVKTNGQDVGSSDQSPEQIAKKLQVYESDAAVNAAYLRRQALMNNLL